MEGADEDEHNHLFGGSLASMVETSNGTPFFPGSCGKLEGQ